MKYVIYVVLIVLSLLWLYKEIKGLIKNVKQLNDAKKNKIIEKEKTEHDS